MPEISIFLLAAGTYVATQTDAMLVYMSLLLSGDGAAARRGYLLCHVVVIVMSVALGTGAAQIPPELIRWLGLVPIGVGLWMLLSPQAEGDAKADGNAEPRASSSLAHFATFMAMSVDSAAVAAALFADTRAQSDGAILVGLLAAVAGLFWLADLAHRKGADYTRLIALADRFAPYIVILAGLYVLLDTGADIQ